MPSSITKIAIKTSNSFTGNFNVDAYDKEINSQPILDIWQEIVIKINQQQKNDTNLFIYTKISKSDTLESLSQKFYGNISLWWLILLINNSSDPFNFINDSITSNEPIKILNPSQLDKVIKNNFNNNSIMTFMKGLNGG